MKSNEEMVSSLLRRRTAYEKEKYARRQTMLRVSTAACSLALVLLIGTGVNQGWWITQEPELPTVTPTQSVTELTEPMAQAPTTAPTQPVQPTEPTVTEPAEQNTIIVHEIDEIPDNRMYIALMVDDFIPMTNEELCDYYGTNFFPTVPGDLGDEWSVENQTALGIFRRDGGTGEVYHDQQLLNWSNEDSTRLVSLQVKKGGMPYQFCVLLTAEFEPSIINNVEVGIGQKDDGIYLVEFLYKDVGFRIIAEGVTQEELVAVIESLIE